MLKNFAKGIVIGIANVLPGVSGGTLAVVLNIYDRLTEAVGNFFTAPMNKKIEYMKFLSQIGIGAVVGIIAFAGIVSSMYTNYPRGTTIVFLLLILPSIPLILKGENIFNKKNILSLFLGIIFTLLFILVTKRFSNGNDEVLRSAAFSLTYGGKLFVCGLISAGAMIIPGISGSLLLLILGEYYNILNYIKSFNILPLVFFSLGMAVGLVGVSKVINILLHKYRSYTLHFIVGIIIVSLFEISAKLI